MLGPTTIVGEVKMWAGNVVGMSGYQEPVTGWALCNGQAVVRVAPYDDLFAVIGTAYGAGDGSTTFNLPNFQGKFALGATSATASVAGGRGYSSGTSTHAHALAIPNHSHSVNAHTHQMTDHIHTVPAHQHLIPNHVHGINISTSYDNTPVFGGNFQLGSYFHNHSFSGNSEGVTYNVLSGAGGDFPSYPSVAVNTNGIAPGIQTGGASDSGTTSAGGLVLSTVATPAVATPGIQVTNHLPPYQIVNYLIKL